MSVIKQLKRIYPSTIVQKRAEVENEEYLWFETKDAEIVGIKREELDVQASELLSLFLQPVHSDQPVQTVREKAWATLLNENEKAEAIKWPASYRFILFSIEDSNPEKEIVQEALQSLFPQEMPLLWNSDREGYIIEEVYSEDQEMISFEGIPDVLMSDFYTNIHFFISEFSNELSHAAEIIKWSEHGAGLAKEHKLGAVITYKDIIPYFYLDALPSQQWNHIRRAIFKEIESDKELLQTIRVFLEAGSNTSLAAKKLYMHRNSLQYRVDKFMEKTGLDIKQFEGAVITYLALLHMNY